MLLFQSHWNRPVSFNVIDFRLKSSHKYVFSHIHHHLKYTYQNINPNPTISRSENCWNWTGCTAREKSDPPLFLAGLSVKCSGTSCSRRSRWMSWARMNEWLILSAILARRRFAWFLWTRFSMCCRLRTFLRVILYLWLIFIRILGMLAVIWPSSLRLFFVCARHLYCCGYLWGSCGFIQVFRWCWCCPRLPIHLPCRGWWFTQWGFCVLRFA